MNLFKFFMAFSILSLFLISSNALANDPPLQLKCLWASYRNFKISFDNKKIILPNGQNLPYKSSYTPEDVDPNNLTSIDQMYLRRYPFGFKQNSSGKYSYAIPSKKDALRGSRYGRLFTYLYGNSAQKVEADLVPIRWVDGSTMLFNRRYGAAKALKKVSYELYALTKEHPEIKKYLRQPLGGTYEWRHIAHSKNMSMHAYGTAIDINVRYSNYWRWEIGSDGVPHYRNYIPPMIAEVFERNGFIWGGKWYHYDTMHFEYRPELVMSRDSCEQIYAKYY